MVTLHGLKTCDSCRRARRWLDDAGIEYRFVDVREQPPTLEHLRRWAAALGWSALLNRRSATWRGLNAQQRDGLDEARALQLLRQHPLLLKRPLLETPDTVMNGFDQADYQALFRR